VTGAALVVVMAGLIGFALAHAQWSSSRSSSGLVNAGSLAEPGVITVDIDVKPGSDPNSTNLGSTGVIPVAILTTNLFDATTVDPVTVDFEGASPVHDALQDVDEDGDLDLIMHFRTQETNIAASATDACLGGETTGGQAIEGCDTIRIVPPWLDSDGDGFGDAVEANVGTDQFAACATNSDDDAWPPDFNSDQSVDIFDVNLLKPAFFSTGAARFDLVPDNFIDIFDINRFKPFFFLSCTP